MTMIPNFSESCSWPCLTEGKRFQGTLSSSERGQKARMKVIESYGDFYKRLQANPSLAAYLGDIDLKLPSSSHSHSESPAVAKANKDVSYRKFKQSCRFLAQQVSASQLVWVSLRTVWPEYGQYFWPGLDITSSLHWLTAKEIKTINRELVHLPLVAPGLRLVTLLFWNFQKEITNIILVREDGVEKFSPCNPRQRMLKLQSSDGAKFWLRTTCKNSYKHWFDLAVHELEKRVSPNAKAPLLQAQNSEASGETEVLGVLLNLAAKEGRKEVGL